MIRPTLCATLVACAPAGAAVAQAVPADDAIARIIADRIDAERRGVGIVVGVVEQGESRVVSHGVTEIGGSVPVDADTVFEIGSITKIFTALLLADMAVKGEVSLDERVAALLPQGIVVPQFDGRDITLVDLATHTAALPVVPDNLGAADMVDPYAGYGVEGLYAFLATLTLPREIGTTFEYSNIGVALLGHALSERTGTPYEDLIETRILEPLGMDATSFTVRDGDPALASPHGPDRLPTPLWTFDVVAPAGGLKSTVNDLIKFLAAAGGQVETPLSPAFALMQETVRPIAEGQDIHLGWLEIATPNGGIVWHNGGTGGSRSFAGYRESDGAAVVVLSNLGSLEGVDDIGLHLLEANIPLFVAPPLPEPIDIDAAVLENYVGTYAITPDFAIAVTVLDGRLFVQATGQQRFETFPESATRFVLNGVDAAVSFAPGSGGAAESLTLHQGGLDQVAERVE